MVGSGTASIWFDAYVKQPLTVSLGTSIVPVQELTLLSGTYFYADFTLDPYKNLYPTVSMGSCIVYPKIIVGQKKLDNIFTSYDQAKKICSYDLMCNNNKIATNQYSSYWGPAEGGVWQKCKHKLYCRNYQDGGKPFEVGSESFPKQTNKMVKYLLILTIAHDNFLIDDATFAARIKEIEKLSYCDKVRFCTTLGYNGLQVWEKISLTNHLEDFGNLSKNITNLGNGCYVVDCPELLKGKDEFCLKDILPETMKNLNIIPPDLENCIPKSYNLYQLILWENALQDAFPKTFVNSKLAELISDNRKNPSAKCATVVFCMPTFKIFSNDLALVDCDPIEVLGNQITTCIPECLNSSCSSEIIECKSTTQKDYVNPIYVFKDFPGQLYFKSYNPNGSSSLNPQENIKFS